jgi:hypothetical protein
MYNVSHASGGNPGSGISVGAGGAGRASPIATSPEVSTGGGAGVESVIPSIALAADATCVDSDILTVVGVVIDGTALCRMFLSWELTLQLQLSDDLTYEFR